MKSCLPGSPDANAAGEQDPRFCLDPARLPQRIELELSDAVIEAIAVRHSEPTESSVRWFNISWLSPYKAASAADLQDCPAPA